MTLPDGVVDAHVHLGPPKYATREVFAATERETGLSGAVLVQHLCNTDNNYLAEARATDPQRYAAVAIVERTFDVDTVLAAGFTGLRLAPRGLPGPDGESVFDALDEHAAIASVTGPFVDVASPAFRSTVRTHPRIHFRVEHVGGFRYGDTPADRGAFAALLHLAEEPNVSLMWSGFFLNAGTEYPYPNVHADLRMTLTAYGSTRIMWSGDWNRTGLADGDYQRAAALVAVIAPDPGQQADILGHTARRVFFPPEQKGS